MSAYRVTAHEGVAAPSTVLRYEARSNEADGSRALFRHFSLPLLVALLAGWLVNPLAVLPVLAVAGAYSAWSWRTRKRAGGAVLRVEQGVLHVEIEGSSALLDRFRLGDLSDVALDTRTIRRVNEGSALNPAARFINTTVGGDLDVARIVLVGAGGRRVALTDEHLAYSETAEWLGKIRTFLRKHEWVPEKERERSAATRCMG
jgi:hypothetical protein